MMNDDHDDDDEDDIEVDNGFDRYSYSPSAVRTPTASSRAMRYCRRHDAIANTRPCQYRWCCRQVVFRIAVCRRLFDVCDVRYVRRLTVLVVTMQSMTALSDVQCGALIEAHTIITITLRFTRRTNRITGGGGGVVVFCSRT
jgi:hypothetical protein